MREDGAVQDEQSPRIPRTASWFIALLTSSAVAVLWWAASHAVVATPLDVLVVLAVVAIAIDSQPLTFSFRGELFSFTLGTPFMLAILVLFGVFPAVLIQLAASVAADFLHRKGWQKTLFNGAQFVVSMGSAGAVLEALLGERIVAPGLALDAGQLPALVVATATFFVVNSLCNITIIQLVTGWRLHQVLSRFLSRESLIEIASLCLAPVIAVSVRHNPVLGVLLTVPIVAIARATRVVMENVMLMEDQAAALEEKHAATLIAQEREAARDAADRANHAKSEFLSQMSHELRTPLNAVLGFAQLLQLDTLTPEQRDGVGEIVKAGEHLLDLINEILDIASIEAGQLRVSLEPVDAAHIVRDCIALVAPLLEGNDVTVRFDEADLGDLVVTVNADRQRLRQVVLNLISNAIKYNRQSGSVLISVRSNGREVRIEIADTGHGIPPEKLGLLFAPFERLGAETTSIEGTGLGLALSKRIIEAMNGTVTVASEVGRGTTFSVELPSAEVSS